MKPVDGNSIMAMRKLIIAQNEALQKAVPNDANQNDVKIPSFGASLNNAIQQVNDLQLQAGSASEAYTMGQTTDIASVMLAKQKASVGFEATLQVRNKLLSAYKDIMSMPV